MVIQANKPREIRLRKVLRTSQSFAENAQLTTETAAPHSLHHLLVEHKICKKFSSSKSVLMRLGCADAASLLSLAITDTPRMVQGIEHNRVAACYCNSCSLE